MIHKSSRALALEALTRVLVRTPPQSLSEALASVKAQSDDPAFVQSLSYGVCRYWNQLSATVKGALSKQLKAKDHDILLVIAMGMYQIHFMRVPDHAAINETVALADHLKKSWAKGLINGVLRQFQRQPQLAQSKPALSLAHPKWILNRIKADWPQDWERVLDANNQPPPMCLRVNQAQTDVASYQSALRDAEIDNAACNYSSVGIRLQTPVDVSLLPDFDSGAVSVQDEAAQLAAELFDARFNKPDCQILDACAAPGGKTLHLFERFSQAQITAVDVDGQRLQRVQENMARLGATLHVVCADVLAEDFDALCAKAHEDSTMGAKSVDTAEASALQAAPYYDAILLDAPCSGTGVIRRHPDIKWLRQAADIDVLADNQLAMLNKLWARLKPGGQLLYCTCSIFKQENEAVVHAFLAERSAENDVKVEPMPAWSPAQNPAEIGWQWLPAADAPDGFYLCLLSKRV